MPIYHYGEFAWLFVDVRQLLGTRMLKCETITVKVTPPPPPVILLATNFYRGKMWYTTEEIKTTQKTYIGCIQQSYSLCQSSLLKMIWRSR